MNNHLVIAINEWLKDFSKCVSYMDVDDETFDGSAQQLLIKAKEQLTCSHQFNTRGKPSREKRCVKCGFITKEL